MKRQRLSVTAIVTIVMLGVAAGGCDQFFEVEGTLTECPSPGTPIVAATVVATVDPTIGQETKTTATDANGKFRIHLNKPPSARVSIAISKIGFTSVTQQFNGLPTTPHRVALCLEPSTGG
jgi:hypothetical protein